MMSGGYEVDVEGEGSTLKYMNNESHALHREERNPHHCFASKFFSTLRKSCLFRTCPIYVHADFTRCSAAEYATQKPGPGGNLTRLSPACVNPLNPIVHFWLHHTAHCAEKIVSARLRAGSASAERVGQGEVGGVTGRVLCTWWLLGLALKRPWLVPGGQPHALTAWTGLENTTLTLQRAGFWPERLLGL